MIQLVPQTLPDLFQALAQMPQSCRIIGGGTDLIIEMQKKARPPEALLYPGNIPELKRLSMDGEKLEIGAAVSMSALCRWPELPPELAALGQAAASVGSEQIRNRATIGGNVANASPSSDMLPALWLFQAEVKLAGPDGLRALPMTDFILGPGRTVLKPDEAIVSFSIPRPPKAFSAFHKVGSRRAVTIARLAVALALTLENDCISRAEVVLGAVAETPLRAGPVEMAMNGRPFNWETMAGAGRALSQYILDINHRPNREYKAWAGPGALADACRKIAAAG